MKHDLMFLELDALIIEPDFTDSTTPQVFAFMADIVDSPLDADDPESALKEYYKRALN